ncbi:LPP20 lipoprotein [Oceanospirillum multiglobuliferum]|uniref:Lipoprotein LPP20-like domain-containing protein n=1 Tax=Oceanospirillum multiglobuliferum TaxID=64969 RepID=A0A1T4RZZ2_9GAMM|nr:LPP20 family lipoprotein [Oceanospirillum multiglobuliferum]OPX54540.1 hypothetical protein BTE48_13705 [Oceanospirillum multiglobuliferum]SKA21563.1 LPP20 lipoprotein [Oceanospirillum multiglobuliferum]
MKQHGYIKRLSTSVRSLALALMLVSLIAGCSGTEPKPIVTPPEWVDVLPEQKGYLFGLGSADKSTSDSDQLELARERARADLIKQLQVTVSSDFSSQSRLEMTDGRNTGFVEVVNDKVRSRIPDISLPGIGWQTSWQHPETGTLYVLARLNRRAAVAQLSEQLSSLDLELSELRLPQTGSRLERVREALPMMALFAKRDKLVQQLSFVAESGAFNRLADEEVRQLRREISRLISSLQISLTAGDLGARALEASLAEELTKLGVQLVPAANSDTDLRLSYTLSLSRTDKNRTFYVFARSAVQIKDNQNHTLRAFERESKGVSSLPDRAQQQAVQQLGLTLAKEIVNAFFY